MSYYLIFILNYSNHVLISYNVEITEILIEKNFSKKNI